MSWMVRLYETYEALVEMDEQEKPWPVSHLVKNAHVEMVLDENGSLKPGRSKILTGHEAPTLIPATEASAGRAGAVISPHPLSDELGYCAKDLPGGNMEKFEAYIQQIQSWQRSDSNQLKLNSIFKYLQMGTLYKDISENFGFPIRFEKKDGTKEKLKDEKVFVRWKVEDAGNPQNTTWEDQRLIKSWIRFDDKIHDNRGLCFISAENTRLAKNNPKFIRRPGDGAKILSSNDHSGYTFRGRFTDSKKSIESSGIQGSGVSYDVSQKAHSALRRLITRQGHKYGASRDDPGSIIIAWAVSGSNIPDPMADSFDFLDEPIREVGVTDESPQVEIAVDRSRDSGQYFSTALSKRIDGYRAKLPPSDNIIIMGLDSATPGRMAITYYQEFTPQDFLGRLEKWYQDFSWFQRRTIEFTDSRGKTKTRTEWRPGTVPPRAIVDAIYGNNASDSLKKSTIERLLPCIVDGRSFPIDMVKKVTQRVVNRQSYKTDEQWLWEKNLGIACSLYRGFSKRDHRNKRKYAMALEEDNQSRDYLYGRLLAIAERIEEIALSVAGENRSTTAARLMQRFADRPASTWRNLELALQPYIQRLKANRAGFLHNQQRLMDEVMGQFQSDDFVSDKPLSGEFLLAFHSQRLELKPKHAQSKETETNGDATGGEQ